MPDLAAKVFLRTTGDQSFGSRALNAYFHSDHSYSKAENEVMARLLHDLKNHLIAYQVQVCLIGDNRTAALKAKYEASIHLDAAMAIVVSAQSIGQAMQNPQITAVNPVEFFRQYLAEKITRVPINIRIDPPKTLDVCEISTATEFLHSILDNLIKNSIEAMPEGGEISIDWIFHPVEKALIIEVTDTGPGIETGLLEQLLLGEAVKSSKLGGSGLRMLTVRAMLNRIGGNLSAVSGLGSGTRWTVVLPSLESSVEQIEGDLSQSNAEPNNVTLQELN